MSAVQELQKMIDIVEKGKSKKERLIGEKESIFKSLKKKFNVSSIQEGIALRKDLKSKKQKVDDQLEKQLNKLKTKYDWK